MGQDSIDKIINKVKSVQNGTPGFRNKLKSVQHGMGTKNILPLPEQEIIEQKEIVNTFDKTLEAFLKVLPPVKKLSKCNIHGYRHDNAFWQIQRKACFRNSRRLPALYV